MKNFLNPSALLTDLYQLTMLQSYLDHDLSENAEFEFFVRDLPESRNFLIAAGLEQVLGFLNDLAFTKEELDWLSRQPYFNDKFIRYLENFKFEGTVEAMPEGTIFFPGEPILRVSAPISQAQLVETRIINLLHYQTMIASKAVRSVLAAQGKLLVDFGLRRAHGTEAGLYAARASHIAGFSGTSTVLAGELYDIPLYGTMAHSFILAHTDEKEAFQNFMLSHPDNVVLLIDTYDISAAIKKVIVLAKDRRFGKIPIKAVRLDSGDLVKHSFQIRHILDQEGLSEIKIFVSGNLDEYSLWHFADSGAPIDGFGVGTLMITSADAPYLECAYKLVSYADTPRFKRSPRKATFPCAKQVYRYYNEDGTFAYDEVTGKNEDREGEALLQRVMKKGLRLQNQRSASEIRSFLAQQIKKLPSDLLSLDKYDPFPVKFSPDLIRMTAEK